MARMKRTQIYLDSELGAALQRLARKRHTSMAALVRSAARRLVDEEEAVKDLLGLIGMATGEPGNISEEHDKYLNAYALGEKP